MKEYDVDVQTRGAWACAAQVKAKQMNQARGLRRTSAEISFFGYRLSIFRPKYRFREREMAFFNWLCVLFIGAPPREAGSRIFAEALSAHRN